MVSAKNDKGSLDGNSDKLGDIKKSKMEEKKQRQLKFPG